MDGTRKGSAMAQKTVSKPVRDGMTRAARRLVPQLKKPLVVVLMVALALCTLGGVACSQGQGVVIARSDDTQVDSSNSQVEHESNEENQAQQEDEGLTSGKTSKDGKINTATEQVEIYYYVHIDGAVKYPGVYKVTKENARVTDAVDCAGGLLENADTTQINLAEALVDGAKIHTPVQGEESKPQGSAQVVEDSGSSTSSSSDGTSSSASGASLVNLNSATVEELQTLPGVGEATAQAIVEDREAHGPFASTEDLMRVSGIGEKKFAKLQDKVCV